jgi:hypothetical protein
MHLSFSLLSIKDLYMFWVLLAHPQEMLHKRHLVYCVRVMSVGCIRIEARSIAQVAFGILLACYVSRMHQDWSGRRRTSGIWYIACMLCQLDAPGLKREAPHKWHSVYCVCVTSVGCTRIEAGGAAQVTLGVLRACYVSWLHQDWSKKHSTSGIRYIACMLCQSNAPGLKREAPHKWYSVYCMHVMSVGCARIEAPVSVLVQPTDTTCTQYTKCHLWSASWGWVSNARNM